MKHAITFLLIYFLASITVIADNNKFKRKENEQPVSVFNLNIKSSSKYWLEFFEKDGKLFWNFSYKNLLNIPVKKTYRFYKYKMNKTEDEVLLYADMDAEEYYFDSPVSGDEGHWWELSKNDKIEFLQTPEEKAVKIEVDEKLKYTKYTIPYCKVNGKIISYVIYLADDYKFLIPLLAKEDKGRLDDISTFELPGYRYNYQKKKFEKIPMLGDEQRDKELTEKLKKAVHHK